MFRGENFISRLSWSISSHSLLKCVLQLQIVENSSKSPLLEVHGCSRSSTLINLKMLSPVLVMISSMSVSICKRLHSIGANNSKITF